MLADALRLDGQPEGVSHGDDRRDDRQVVGVAGNVAHERLVDLELVDRESLEVRKRRIARAEIVEREFKSQPFELTHDADRVLGVLHRHALGDLELQRMRTQARAAHRIFDRFGQVVV